MQVPRRDATVLLLVALACGGLDTTRSVRLRPGNAGANTIADPETVPNHAIAQLPEAIAVGHRPGDDPSLVRRPVHVRVDSAGCAQAIFEWIEVFYNRQRRDSTLGMKAALAYAQEADPAPTA